LFAALRADCRYAAFAQSLADHNVFVIRGSPSELPGYFRISLTGSEEMIERSLPTFAEVHAHHSTSGDRP
jgi:aspartate aminotransferase